MWAQRFLPNLEMQFLRDVLKRKEEMSIEDAIFRNTDCFIPANLQNHLPFWEHEMLKDHPHKETILKWLQGVQIEEFLNSYTLSILKNYVQEWVNLGVLEKWNDVRSPEDPEIISVVCPIGVEPKKTMWFVG